MLVIPSSYWSVVKTKHKGRGVFARKVIEPGTVVADYVGRILTNKQADAIDALMGVFRSDDEVIWPADTKAIGAHVVNHSCAASCGYYPYRGHVLIVSLRRIFPGEELTADYMMDPPTDYKPSTYYPCLCESKFCRSTMYSTVDHSNRFTYDFLVKKQGKYIKKMLVPFGQVLPLLPKYPDQVKDEPIYSLYGSATKKPFIINTKSLLSIKQLRGLIRETGRYLKFPFLGVTVYGINDGLIVAGK